MNFATIDGERRAAQPGLAAVCPACGKPMLAKCGKLRVWHWAHRGIRSCDQWWEPETEWHRAWKNHFPEDWQEFVHRSAEGEIHIADVKTAHGVTLEFQHSFLNPAERASREAFYQKMAWIIDGRRRIRDRAQFFTALRDGSTLSRQPHIAAAFVNESAMMRDWAAARAPVYFDLGASEEGDVYVADGHVLWRFFPRGDGRAYLSPIPKAQVVHAYREGMVLDDAFHAAFEGAAIHERTRQATLSSPLVGFEHYMMARQRSRSRF